MVWDKDMPTERISEHKLDVSLSNVKYAQIAPYLGLNPMRRGTDMKKLQVFRSRIPNALFEEIANDISLAERHYGDPENHENEKARSRFLTSIFNRIVGLFRGAIVNKPEVLLESKSSRKGRIGHRFYTLGVASVVFIEVKKQSATPRTSGVMIQHESEGHFFAAERLLDWFLMGFINGVRAVQSFEETMYRDSVRDETSVAYWDITLTKAEEALWALQETARHGVALLSESTESIPKGYLATSGVLENQHWNVCFEASAESRSQAGIMQQVIRTASASGSTPRGSAKKGRD
ncbi:hypothetical protein BJY01DRAFT_255118 [Aspergillus pseudoustus]|uniref:Fungal-type protein kinase domain-containing protein n=1 Tax=Aspergillus pseudoustus TaxID=1810923 RepID=A0ABR4IMY3_9EURO